MIALSLSAHRSQIRVRDKPMLLFPPSFSQKEAEATNNWKSELFFPLFWSVLGIERGGEEDATLAPRLCCHYLGENKKGASGMRPLLQWAPAATRRHAKLVHTTEALFQCRAHFHVSPSALMHIEIMWKSVNERHIIWCVCIINYFTIDAIRVTHPKHIWHNMRVMLPVSLVYYSRKICFFD